MLTIVYWICFFFVPDSVQSFAKEPSYMIFEKTFFAADMWMTLAFFLCADYLLKKNMKGILGNYSRRNVYSDHRPHDLGPVTPESRDSHALTLGAAFLMFCWVM